MERRYRWLSDWFYFFCAAPLLASLPESVSRALTRLQAAQFYRNAGATELSVIRHNLATVFAEKSAGQIEQIVRGLFQTRTIEDLECFNFRALDSANLHSHFKFEGLEHVEGAKAGGCGSVLITAHVGSFCSAVAAMGLGGFPLNYLANDAPEGPDFPPAYRGYARRKIRWMEGKGKRPFILFPVGGDESERQNAALAAYGKLKKNELLAVAIDVPPRLFRNSESVEFLGMRCRFPSGFLKIAEMAGSPVIPFFCLLEPDYPSRRRIVIQEPVHLTKDLRSNLQACVDRLEGVIRAHPEQWLGWDSLSQFFDRE